MFKSWYAGTGRVPESHDVFPFPLRWASMHEKNMLLKCRGFRRTPSPAFIVDTTDVSSM